MVDEVSKRLSALTEKERLYLLREKLVIGYKDQLNSLWHIMHFLHLNRLCQTQHGGFLQAQGCFLIYKFFLHVCVCVCDVHKHKITALTTNFVKYGEAVMPKTISVKFVLFWFEGIYLAFHACQGLKIFLKIKRKKIKRISSKKANFI